MLIEERIPDEEALNKAIGYLVTKQIELLETIEQWKNSTNFWQQKCHRLEEQLAPADKVKEDITDFVRGFKTEDDIDTSEVDKECLTD